MFNVLTGHISLPNSDNSIKKELEFAVSIARKECFNKAYFYKS